MSLQQDACIKLINQIAEIEKKLASKQDTSFQRNFQRIKDTLSESGYQYASPLGEAYNETRTDCEASISGNSTDSLVISEVIKPIIWIKENNLNVLVQKAVVIVSSK